MDFDFEGLEEALPAVMTQITCMTEHAFRRFRSRLEEAEGKRRYDLFGDAVAEAIWDEAIVAERMPKIVKAFQSLLDEVTRRSPPDIEAGGAICYLLWQLGLSTSLQETRVRPSQRSAPPVALVTGFGGSNVDDLEGQASWYESQGFHVISTSRAGFPPVLQQKHNFIIANELRNVLQAGSEVVFHLCSQYGVIFGVEILWQWAHDVPPFDRLPPAGGCLKAVVFDCAAPPNFDPVSQKILYPTDLAGIEWMLGCHREEAKQVQEQVNPDEVKANSAAQEDSALFKSEDKFYLNVLLGCTGSLTKKHRLGSLEEMVPGNKEVRKCLMAAAQYWRKPHPWVQKCREKVDINTPGDPWAALQWLDWKRGDAFPRLFLYSKIDLLVTTDRVEAFIRHTRTYRPEATILEAKLEKSAHCRLWDTEVEACGAAVSDLLRIAGVRLGG